MKPTIGRIVCYNTTKEERDAMPNVLRANKQYKLPAIIVAVWGTDENACVNLKVILDGPGELWVTSVNRGDEEMNWNWFEIKK